MMVLKYGVKMEIREYEKDLFIAFCKLWHTNSECNKSGCEVKDALDKYDSGVGSFDEILEIFKEVDGDWDSWNQFRDDNFNLLLDTAENITRAGYVVVAKMRAYLFDMKGLSKIIKVFRPKPYTLSGGKKYR